MKRTSRAEETAAHNAKANAAVKIRIARPFSAAPPRVQPRIQPHFRPIARKFRRAFRRKFHHKFRRAFHRIVKKRITPQSFRPSMSESSQTRST